MGRHVHVAVVSRSHFDGGTDTLTYSGSGLLRREEGGWHLRYTAHGEDGSALASDVQLCQGYALLRNIGAGYTLRLEVGREEEICLPTPQGELALQVRAHSLAWQVEQPAGEIHMDYTLSTAGEPLSRLELTIQLRDR